MKNLFYIDYPQTPFEGQMYRYRCAFCLEETTKINGRLEGHLPDCQYRINLEKAGHDIHCTPSSQTLFTTDSDD